MATKFYLFLDDEKRGPFSREELIDAGMQRDTLVWFKGCTDWLPAEEVEELADLVSGLPPNPPRRARSDAETPKRLPLNVQDGKAVLGTSRATLATLLGVGSLLYVPGLLLLLGAGILSAIYGIHGIHDPSGFYDPAAKMIRHQFDKSNRFREDLVILAIGVGIFFGVVGMAGGAICYMALLSRAWSLIQDGRAATTPGKAVGLLFVPYFNCYWVFIAFWTLARDLDRFANRYSLNTPPAPRGLGAAIAVNHAVGAVPLLGLVTLTLNFFLMPLYMWFLYRTTAAMVNEENRERLASNWNAPSAVEPAVSAWGRLFVIGALVLAPVGLALFVPGMLVELDAVRDYRFGSHHADISRTGAAHLRGQFFLNEMERQRLNTMDAYVNNWDRTWSSMRLNRVYLWGAVWAFGAAILLAAMIAGVMAWVLSSRLARNRAAD